MDPVLFVQIANLFRMKLERYKDLSGSGGITGYKFLDDGIMLQFKYRDLYLYDDKKPGKGHIEQMKILAKRGKGLTTYVNQNVRENFKEKIK
jgi:hypothetical protein